MNKIPEDELENYIKQYNICHFKKVNLIGTSNVGKRTLLSYIEHYIDKQKDFVLKDSIENIDINNNNGPLVEMVKKLSITYYETKRLYINLYIANIDNTDKIK